MAAEVAGEGKGTGAGEGRRPPRARRRLRAAAPPVRRKLALDDLHADPENRRHRTPRGAAMLVDALHQVGAGRSIVIDEANHILAGNGVVEAAALAGITGVRVVDTDGSELVAVRRRDLTPEQKRQLAMYDNRTGELAEWNPQQLAADAQRGLDLQPFFDAAEIRTLLKDANGKELKVEEVQTRAVADRFWISVRGPLAAQAKALQRLRQLMTELDGVEVEIGTIAVEELVGLG